MNNAIEISNLKKSYQEKQVLKGVSLTVKQGEIFALLGANGAGKTTTLECVEGLKKKDSGTIHLNGSYGVQLQSSTLPKNMKAKEALALFAKWNHKKIDDSYLNRIGVASFVNQQYGKLSTGQKRRLHLALAILGEPDILFLDEPTAGLDVEGRVQIHNEIRHLKEQGKTIFLTSHDMAEVEELCDVLAVLKDGEIIFTGTPGEMKNRKTGETKLLIRFSQQNAGQFMPETLPYQEKQGYFVFEANDLTAVLSQLARLTEEHQLNIADIKTEGSSLEQQFLALAKEEA